MRGRRWARQAVDASATYADPITAAASVAALLLLMTLIGIVWHLFLGGLD